MKAETTKLTIRLPREDVEFAKTYAAAHGVSLTEFIDRYLRRIRSLEKRTLGAELDVITGLVPRDIDVEDEYRQHLRNKHAR